jgi:hypothetical protein
LGCEDPSSEIEKLPMEIYSCSCAVDRETEKSIAPTKEQIHFIAGFHI